MENKTCKQLVKGKLKSEIGTLRNLWESYQRGEEHCEIEEGYFPEHGLGFDYVAKGTFKGQKEGYFRYQISWGGPAAEFRFFVNPDYTVYRIEYWYLDWFDGAKVILKDKDYDLLEEIFNDFKECGTVEAELKKSVED